MHTEPRCSPAAARARHGPGVAGGAEAGGEEAGEDGLAEAEARRAECLLYLLVWAEAANLRKKERLEGAAVYPRRGRETEREGRG